jgi:histidyl-tRNA synthetase
MKPSTPQGTRDFAPDVLRKRYYILNTIRSIMERYGFQPLETPAMENLSTLTGKYGDEGDKLIFRILNNGLATPDKIEKTRATFDSILEGKNGAEITDRALRYDLTIPFARFVAMNQNALAFPFKRFQMQPVWRADRPQKGRYREFYQCDADVVGSTSLLNEAELLMIYDQAFTALNFPLVEIRINSRKILAGLANYVGMPEQMTNITVAIDKLDKIGLDGVKKELTERGIPESGISAIEQFLSIDGDNVSKLEQVAALMGTDEVAQQGIAELRTILDYTATLQQEGSQNQIMVDLTLARGLNYYTGMIVEVKCPSVAIGSIGGGGRYDDLTGLFGVKGLSGVGISFGIDRMYDAMESLDIFPDTVIRDNSVLFINFGGADERYALQQVTALRTAGITAELYPDAAKFDKQMKYANKRNIPYVAICGENERMQNIISIKNFLTGSQEQYTITEAIALLKP